MAQQLSLSARPRSLDELVGQARMVASIRNLMKSGRTVTQWMFTGPTGCGKTTTARILSLSFVCTHQKLFGQPCKECRLNKSNFDIYEINAAKLTGKDLLEQALDGADYAPRFGPYRVYIIDEVHRASPAAQDLVLKYLEDSAETTVFILCSTEAHLVRETIQTRVAAGFFQLRPLEYDTLVALVDALLQKAKSDLPSDRLVDELISRGVQYPRLVANAVEKYVAGDSPEDAAQVQASVVVDTKELRAVLRKGDWGAVAAFLGDISKGLDTKSVRLSLIGYLRQMLIECSEIDDRTDALAKALAIMCETRYEDAVVSAGLVTSLYQVCRVFSKYKR